MKYRIDVVLKRKTDVVLSGWAIGKSPDSIISFQVFEEDKEIDFKHIKVRRDAVSELYFKKVYDKDFGFDIIFDYDKDKTYYLYITADKKTVKIKIDEEFINFRNSSSYRKKEKLKALFNIQSLEVVITHLIKFGPKSLARKIKNKLKGIETEYDYPEWYRLTEPDKSELEKQRKHKFAKTPKFSIVIPVFETPDNYLKQLIDSIQKQTYTNFEICFADGSRNGNDKKAVIENYSKKDKRIKYKLIGDNLGISGNTNEALKMAEGDYIVLCDHDDLLTPDALFECAKAINEKDADCIYSDEDKIDMDGTILFDPHFKPDFNIDLLRSVNYICHLFVAKKTIVEEIGMFNKEYDGAQDYDFIFRVTEKAKNIVHIPKVLYHWRSHINSTAANPESKLYAFEAGARAIKAHYDRVLPDIKIKAIEKGFSYGIYHTFFEIENEPLISVIIPNKDHHLDLDKAIRSVYEKGNYKNLEFIVVENNSTEEETFKYYEDIQKEFPNVKVVYWDREFNYSEINNFGASFANGEYLLLLNNDVELINPDAIYEMLGYAQRSDVGICGCRLLYEDDVIQHAGVVVGFGGIAGHAFIGLHKDEITYFSRALIAQDYSAVTAACLLTKKEVFNKVGGLSPEFAVAFNDIDFCMKVREAGYLVVYNPYAEFYHYESKSRGLEDTPEKIDRFNREIAKFLKKWPDIIKDGDPYYNPNLTLLKSNFALKDLTREKIGKPYKIKDIEKYM